MFNAKHKSETALILLAVLNAGHRQAQLSPGATARVRRCGQFPVLRPQVFRRHRDGCLTRCWIEASSST
jgi:hypothetical protein